MIIIFYRTPKQRRISVDETQELWSGTADNCSRHFRITTVTKRDVHCITMWLEITEIVAGYRGQNTGTREGASAKGHHGRGDGDSRKSDFCTKRLTQRYQWPSPRWYIVTGSAARFTRPTKSVVCVSVRLNL